MKKILKSVIFIFIFVILFSYTFHILWLDKTGITYFFEEPSNSLDVVYVGASNAFNHFNPVLAYNKYGYTTGLLSTSSEPFATMEYMIKEAEKYQSPRLYIIDITKVTDDLYGVSEAAIRKSLDSIKFSKNRIDAINETLKYKKINKQEYINYYFSFLKYHNRWKEISSIQTSENNDLYKGYVLDNLHIGVKKNKEYKWQEGTTKLLSNNEKLLIKLINSMKVNKSKVLFIIPKRFFKEEYILQLNYATDIIKENGFNVINFNTLEDLIIDTSSEYFDEEHLNVYGATKFTLYFSKYIKENYDLPDHRNDEKYDSWKSEYERFKTNFNILTNRNFDELL